MIYLLQTTREYQAGAEAIAIVTAEIGMIAIHRQDGKVGWGVAIDHPTEENEPMVILVDVHIIEEVDDKVMGIVVVDQISAGEVEDEVVLNLEDKVGIVTAIEIEEVKTAN